VQDAEDATQDALIRAWQGLAAFEGRASMKSWLYKIATNVCLDLVDKRRVRVLPHDIVAPGDPRAALPPPATERAWIEPIPDAMLVADEAGPEARVAARESVALAFVALLQTMPGKQRAALVMRDVLGFSANETADALDTSVAAVNSALQRARETLEAQPARPGSLDDEAGAAVVERVVRAWEASDTGAMLSALREDAIFSMPPLPLWFRGREPIGDFFRGFLFAHGAQYRAIATRANGRPAVAIYQRGENGFQFGALDVLEIADGGVREIVAFLAFDPALSAERFGLAARL
jgi:RNA polymerase sigma-70 factor (ECF subfamily)